MNYKKFFLVSLSVFISVIGCKKDEDDGPATTPVTPAEVLNDFTNTLAIPNYTDLQAKAVVLNQASVNLRDSATEANLQTAREAWRSIRQA